MLVCAFGHFILSAVPTLDRMWTEKMINDAHDTVTTLLFFNRQKIERDFFFVRHRKEYTDANTNYLCRDQRKHFSKHNWIKSHVNKIGCKRYRAKRLAAVICRAFVVFFLVELIISISGINIFFQPLLPSLRVGFDYEWCAHLCESINNDIELDWNLILKYFSRQSSQLPNPDSILLILNGVRTLLLIISS